MTLKTPPSLTLAGLFLKVISWVIVVQALGELKNSHNGNLTVFLELCGIGLFILAWKMQNDLREWARIACWSIALLAGGYFIWDYSFKALSSSYTTNPPRLELLLGICFIWIFGYLNHPSIRRLFKLAK